MLLILSSTFLIWWIIGFVIITLWDFYNKTTLNEYREKFISICGFACFGPSLLFGVYLVHKLTKM